MKNYILSLLFCVLTAITSTYGQTEFAPIGAEWYYSWDNGLRPTRLHYAHYRSEKDSIFKGKSCRQIEVENVRYDGVRSKYWLYTYTSGDTVFHFNWWFDKFTPLFIFNVQAGDTLQFHIPEYRAFTDSPPGGISGDSIIHVIVEKVDTLIINDIPLRRVWLNRYIDGYADVGIFSPYIERIGSIFNFWPYYLTIQPYLRDIPEYRSGAFRCYTDSLISYHTILPCDTLIPGPVGIIGPDKALYTDLLVYPNPSKGNFTIHTKSGYPDQGQINITDLSGRVIHQLLIPKEKQETYEFSLKLPAGIYILQWEQNNNAYTQKLVIQP